MSGYRKVKSPPKEMLTAGPVLEKKVLGTMKLIADAVGATLGPSGRPVLIERQEYGLPHIFTKDGVTVFRALGFSDPTAHAIMEAARDAATRTVAEAGDGTTTATVLAEAIVRYTFEFCAKNPRYTSQKVVRELESVFKTIVEPKIKEWARPADEKALFNVARISANGDTELATSVLECFDAVGDEGAISVVEQSGPSHYEVEKIKGFPVAIGYEESIPKLFQVFLNDKANNRCVLDKPVFVLYNGSITESMTFIQIMEKVGRAQDDFANMGLDKPFNHNVVLVANGFSETVLGNLAMNFSRADTINVVPMLAPRTEIQNSESYFLYDLASVVGATVFDPITNPLPNAELSDLGRGIDRFEMSRYRSVILGLSDPDLVIARAEEIKQGADSAESKQDLYRTEERVARLVGGIAKLKVIGASNGELREKRDRVEDAIASVRGAKKHGFLPGGCWTLLKLMDQIPDSPVCNEILGPALAEPFRRLLANCGEVEEDIEAKTVALLDFTVLGTTVYDAMENKWIDAIEGGILDSTPAVLEAIRNSISIASLLGTVGCTVVFERDVALEQKEASDTMHYLSSTGGDM